MSEYRYKLNSDIDAYGETMDVIHLKFGEMRKMYYFTSTFRAKHYNFCREYENYWNFKKGMFSDPLAILNYIETFDIPVRLYSNYVDEEFEDVAAAKEWLLNEYQGQNKSELYKYDDGGYVGLDGERSEIV